MVVTLAELDEHDKLLRWVPERALATSLIMMLEFCCVYGVCMVCVCLCVSIHPGSLLP